MKLRNYLKSFLILCFLPVLFVHAGATNAAPLNCGGWSVIPSANPGTPDGLTAVAAVSSTDVWAVGGSGSQRGSGQPVIEQWNGTQWNAVSPASTTALYSILYSVAVVSANDVWAVGWQGINGVAYTLIEHWNGTQWNVVKGSGPGPVSNSLLSVTAVSASDIWAVGYYQSSDYMDHSLTEHWNGKVWAVVTSPSPGMVSTQLEGAAAISAHDVWAVGHVDSTTLTEHYC